MSVPSVIPGDRRPEMSEYSAKYNYTNDCPVCGKEYHGDHAIEAAEECIGDGHYEGRNAAYVYIGGISYGDSITVLEVPQEDEKPIDLVGVSLLSVFLLSIGAIVWALMSSIR